MFMVKSTKNQKELWKGVFLSFNMLTSHKNTKGISIFTNYYILGQRSSYYLINPYAVANTLSRIFILIKGMLCENKEYSRWVFSFNVKHAAICRWFGWSVGASIFARLSKNNGIISNGGLLMFVKSSMVAYTFLSYIGMDLAFVLSSKSSGGRAELLTQKSLMTIGFDGNDVWSYAFSLPGVRSTRSVVLYARIFSMLLLKL